MIQSRLKALKTVPVSSLDPFKFGNPRVMGDAMRAHLRTSMEELGVVQPIIVRESPGAPDRYEIINGHHRYDVMKEAGLPKAEVVVVDLPDDQKARALVLALNQISADWDQQALSSYVSSWLAENGDDGKWFQGVTGFSADEIEVLKTSLGRVEEAVGAGLSPAEPEAAPDPLNVPVVFPTATAALEVLGKYRLDNAAAKEPTLDGSALARVVLGG